MKTGLIPYKKTADCQKTAALFIKKDYTYMEFSSLQNLFDYAKRDRYSVTDAEWEEARHPRDDSGQFANRNGESEHNQTNVRIERFLSQPIKLKSGKEARACITVKHSLDRNGHNIYSLEAMDIKNALEKTRAKGQPKDSDCPHTDNITHDMTEVKSIAGLWRIIKSA